MDIVLSAAAAGPTRLAGHAFVLVHAVGTCSHPQRRGARTVCCSRWWLMMSRRPSLPLAWALLVHNQPACHIITRAQGKATVVVGHWGWRDPDPCSCPPPFPLAAHCPVSCWGLGGWWKSKVVGKWKLEPRQLRGHDTGMWCPTGYPTRTPTQHNTATEARQETGKHPLAQPITRILPPQRPPPPLPGHTLLPPPPLEASGQVAEDGDGRLGRRERLGRLGHGRLGQARRRGRGRRGAVEHEAIQQHQQRGSLHLWVQSPCARGHLCAPARAERHVLFGRVRRGLRWQQDFAASGGDGGAVARGPAGGCVWVVRSIAQLQLLTTTGPTLPPSCRGGQPLLWIQFWGAGLRV